MAACRAAGDKSVHGDVNMERREFLERTGAAAHLVEAWVEAGWLLPTMRDGRRNFTEVDLARARLIRDLRVDLGVNDEGIAVILDLVDQLHGVRRTLDALLSAISAQPLESRQRISVSMRQVLATGRQRRAR